ncbi:porin family protein [Pedobacter fastidiosus]|uniref:porin family protein n=1 Tax=Pedobacter fastidiosus TaxID=2765361 RepID=UPI0036227C81
MQTYNDFTDAGFATDPLVGFHGGVTVAYKFTDNLMIQQELLFSTQGAKVLSGPLGAQDLKLSYFSIPLLIKYRSEFGFYGEIGGQVSFKIDEQVANFSGTDFAKKLDYGAIAGLGYRPNGFRHRCKICIWT